MRGIGGVFPFVLAVLVLACSEEPCPSGAQRIGTRCLLEEGEAADAGDGDAGGAHGGLDSSPGPSDEATNSDAAAGDACVDGGCTPVTPTLEFGIDFPWQGSTD
ncbi:MAG: hypothetical protein QM778_27540 [Myxococcales bacterium]